MIFDDNTAFQSYRILVAILGTLAMFATTTPLKLKRNRLILGGYLCYAVLFTLVCIRFWGFLPFLRTALFTITLPGVLLVYLLSDTSFSRHIFNCLTHLLLSLYLITSVTVLNTFFGGSLYSDAVLLLSAYLLAVFLEYRFLRKPFLTVAGTITRGWNILASVPLAFFILAMAVILYPEHYTQNPSALVIFYLLGFVILIIYYAIFQYFWMQYNYQVEEQNRAILELQMQGIRNIAQDTKRNAEEIFAVWTDTHRLLSDIAALAAKGDARGILKFTAEASANNYSSGPANYCSDPILNATLTGYFHRARQSAIQLELHLDIPQVLPVESTDLSICFANALENAIKACEKLPAGERKILVKCIHTPTFMFEISNPYSEPVTLDRHGLPQSPEYGHGIGTRSIAAFCEKYNAFYSFSTERGIFKLLISL